MEVIQAMEINAMEIVSVLDDGSVIETSNANISESYFADQAELGFFVQISTDADMAELLALHEAAIRSEIDTPTIGLRKLTTDNWAQYARYVHNFANQCQFKCNKKDNPPAPFHFPGGECVQAGSSQPVLAEQITPLVPF